MAKLVIVFWGDMLKKSTRPTNVQIGNGNGNIEIDRMQWPFQPP